MFATDNETAESTDLGKLSVAADGSVSGDSGSWLAAAGAAGIAGIGVAILLLGNRRLHG